MLDNVFQGLSRTGIVLLLLAALTRISMRIPLNRDMRSTSPGRFMRTAVILAFLAVELSMSGPPSEATFWYFTMPDVVVAFVAATLVDWLLARPGLELSELSALAAGLVGLASWLQYYPVPDVRHLYWAAAPGIGVFVFGVRRLVRGRTLTVALGLGLLMAPLIAQRGGMYLEKLRLPSVPVRDHPMLEGMRLLPEQEPVLAPFLSSLREYLETRPDAPLLVYGHDQIGSCLVRDLRNPSNYWQASKEFPVPDPDQVLALRRDFIPRNRPLVVFQWYDLRLTRLRWPPPPESLERSDAVITDLKVNLEDVVRRFGYRELRRTILDDSTTILLGPPD